MLLESRLRRDSGGSGEGPGTRLDFLLAAASWQRPLLHSSTYDTEQALRPQDISIITQCPSQSKLNHISSPRLIFAHSKYHGFRGARSEKSAVCELRVQRMAWTWMHFGATLYWPHMPHRKNICPSSCLCIYREIDRSGQRRHIGGNGQCPLDIVLSELRPLLINFILNAFPNKQSWAAL